MAHSLPPPHTTTLCDCGLSRTRSSDMTQNNKRTSKTLISC
ncbi:hypothetical protein AZE42_10579 [Rhizopogon vesiculosus]|uniref:Uncharacterized protein n=1 Tax=Rhizopogon vesiculosus TaxID=180088 RepID=A0A1J8Q1Z3_9AGAM|nr:hypothetical protein AZE42_10579 [Rhizopogon vesiculosus]